MCHRERDDTEAKQGSNGDPCVNRAVDGPTQAHRVLGAGTEIC